MVLRGLIVLQVLLGSLAAPMAGAAPEPAQEQIQRGLELYRNLHFEEAIEAFQRAYALQPLPRLLFNIGQAHYKRGDYREALSFYERYRLEEPQLEPAARGLLEEMMRRARAPLEEPAPAPLGSEVRPALFPRPEAPAVPKAALLPATSPPSPSAPRPRPWYRRPLVYGVAAGVVAVGVTTAVVLGLKPWEPDLSDVGTIYDLQPR